jgi:hypothetical protein
MKGSTKLWLAVFLTGVGWGFYFTVGLVQGFLILFWIVQFILLGGLLPSFEGIYGSENIHNSIKKRMGVIRFFSLVYLILASIWWINKQADKHL